MKNFIKITKDSIAGLRDQDTWIFEDSEEGMRKFRQVFGKAADFFNENIDGLSTAKISILANSVEDCQKGTFFKEISDFLAHEKFNQEEIETIMEEYDFPPDGVASYLSSREFNFEFLKESSLTEQDLKIIE